MNSAAAYVVYMVACLAAFAFGLSALMDAVGGAL